MEGEKDERREELEEGEEVMFCRKASGKVPGHAMAKRYFRVLLC